MSSSRQRRIEHVDEASRNQPTPPPPVQGKLTVRCFFPLAGKPGFLLISLPGKAWAQQVPIPTTAAPSSRPAQRHGHDLGLRAIGRAHGLSCGAGRWSSSVNRSIDFSKAPNQARSAEWFRSHSTRNAMLTGYISPDQTNHRLPEPGCRVWCRLDDNLDREPIVFPGAGFWRSFLGLRAL